MFVVGVDENGLGPLLGPLVVTAVAFETAAYEKEEFFSTVRKYLPADDSKKVFGRNQSARAEAMTMAWLKAFELEVKTHSELMGKVQAKYPLKRPCKPNVPVYCTPANTALPYVSNSPPCIEPVNARSALESENIKPVLVRTVSVCPGSLNLATSDPNTNKFNLDFRLMMHLATEISKALSSDLTVLCGKVGSTRRYGKWFSDCGLDAWWVEEESPQKSTYRVNQIGKVSFIRDGDASHLPIAVASMIGKYIRELEMHSLNNLLGAPNERYASGYRDKITAKFASNTKERRREIGLIDGCFYRNS